MLYPRRWWLRLVVMLVVVGVLMTGCTLNVAPPAGDAPAPLTVAVAANMEAALTEIVAQYEAATGQSVTLVVGATGQLAQQLENGAPFDLFVAADTATVDRLAAAGVLNGESVAVYARGRLVLAVNRAAGVEATTLEDLLNPAIRNVAIANPETAPYGLAAQQALTQLGLWDALQPKLVLGENIRQTLQYVQSGDAEAGLVALALTPTEESVPEIMRVLVDESLHAPLDQALGVVTASAQAAAAQALADAITGPIGQAILPSYGFVFPESATR